MATWGSVGQGRDASNGNGNEGENVGKLHLERLFDFFQKWWIWLFDCVVTVVFECLLIVMEGVSGGHFIDEVDEALGA